MMESVLKKIFFGKIDDSVHEEFIKYGKGKFKDKYLIECKKKKDKFIIKASHEFSNFFVRRCLESVSPEEEIEIKGIIVCTKDISSDIKFEINKIKKYLGIQQLIIDCKVMTSKILELMDKHPRVYYGLSLKTPSCELKIKAKAPKSAKPSSKGDEEPKADFCSFKTSDREIVNDLFFDFPDFNEIKVKHIIKIDEVILPEGEDDPVKIRELAKKRGKIIREVSVNGHFEKKEKEFVA